MYHSIGLLLLSLLGLSLGTDSHIRTQENWPDTELSPRETRGIFRYGKRGGLFRYGRSQSGTGHEDDSDLYNNAKRLFRWGKRSDDVGSYKRLFRWGKRSDDVIEREPMFYSPDVVLPEAKKKLFRYGKRSTDRAYPRGTRNAARSTDAHVPFRFGEEKE